MKYEITEGGIRYTIPTETIAEELATDAIEDAQKPITQAEIIATIRRIHDEQEAMERELLGQSRSGSD